MIYKLCMHCRINYKRRYKAKTKHVIQTVKKSDRTVTKQFMNSKPGDTQPLLLTSQMHLKIKVLPESPQKVWNTRSRRLRYSNRAVIDSAIYLLAKVHLCVKTNWIFFHMWVIHGTNRKWKSELVVIWTSIFIYHHVTC